MNFNIRYFKTFTQVLVIRVTDILALKLLLFTQEDFGVSVVYFFIHVYFFFMSSVCRRRVRTC